MKGFLLIVPCGLHPTQEVQSYRIITSLLYPEQSMDNLHRQTQPI